jgi:hypothetical protein
MSEKAGLMRMTFIVLAPFTNEKLLIRSLLQRKKGFRFLVVSPGPYLLGGRIILQAIVET